MIIIKTKTYIQSKLQPNKLLLLTNNSRNLKIKR